MNLNWPASSTNSTSRNPSSIRKRKREKTETKNEPQNHNGEKVDDSHLLNHHGQNRIAHDTPKPPGDPDPIPLVYSNNNTVTQWPTSDTEPGNDPVTDVEKAAREPGYDPVTDVVKAATEPGKAAVKVVEKVNPELSQEV